MEEGKGYNLKINKSEQIEGQGYTGRQKFLSYKPFPSNHTEAWPIAQACYSYISS